MASENIFQQYLRPVKSVAEYSADYDEADARKQAMQTNALALAAGQQKMADSSRDRDADNALSRLYASGQTPDQIAVGLAQQGYGKQAMAFTKQQQDLANAKATGGHLTAQTDKLTAESGEIARKQREEKRQKAITDIAAFTDPQQAAASLKLHIDAGDVDPQQGALIMQSIPQNPADFPKWQVGMLQRIMAADKAAGQILPDANNVATNARTAADAAAGREVTKRGQDITAGSAAASRAQAERHFNVKEARDASAPKGQIVQGDDGPMIVDPRTGKATAVTMNGAPVAPKGTAAKAQDAQSVINLLDLAEPLLNTATHSRTGQAYDATLALVGKSTEGAQAAAQLRALEGALIAKQPKMSGPQSDKDVLLYRQMAGQIGDPAVPIETRRAAMKTVRALNQKYVGATAPTAAAPAAGIPSGWSVKEH